MTEIKVAAEIEFLSGIKMITPILVWLRTINVLVHVYRKFEMEFPSINGSIALRHYKNEQFQAFLSLRWGGVACEELCYFYVEHKLYNGKMRCRYQIEDELCYEIKCSSIEDVGSAEALADWSFLVADQMANTDDTNRVLRTIIVTNRPCEYTQTLGILSIASNYLERDTKLFLDDW